MIDNLAEVIQAMTPKNLDDIIRKHRDLAKLRMTTDLEIMFLHHQITPCRPKAVMHNWSLITLHLIESDLQQVLLIGDVEGTTVTRLTSLVVQIDLDRQLLLTKNGSIYRLGNKKFGEPDVYQLMAICACFHSWGFGQALGVPYFFY